MKIIEFEEKYLEDIKDLMVELEVYLSKIDKDKLDRVHKDYREKSTYLSLNNIKENNGICYLAIEKDKVFGLIIGSIPDYQEYDYIDYKCPRRGVIDEFIVTSKSRNNGVGKLLIDSMEKYFKKNHCEYEIVDVFAYNNIGISFYSKNNFHNRMHTMIKKLDVKDEYICKIANINEIEEKTNYEIKLHPNNIIWKDSKKNCINGFNNGSRIVYVGILNNNIICEATAIIKKIGFIGETNNIDKLLPNKAAYLCAFRTKKEYENKGLFKRLYNYMEKDLKSKGYKTLILGVEPCEIRNIQIYFKLGFINYIKTDKQTYPNGEQIQVNYYSKNI